MLQKIEDWLTEEATISPPRWAWLLYFTGAIIVALVAHT